MTYLAQLHTTLRPYFLVYIHSPMMKKESLWLKIKSVFLFSQMAVSKVTTCTCLMVILMLTHISEGANYWRINRFRPRPNASGRSSRYRQFTKRAYQDELTDMFNQEEINIAKQALLRTIVNLYSNRYDVDTLSPPHPLPKSPPTSTPLAQGVHRPSKIGTKPKAPLTEV